MIGSRFERGDLIAQGAMGVVYKGLDRHTGTPVAIKQLKRDLIDLDETLIDRFQREGEALARLNHPNIVKMIAALEENGENYLIMEYVDGGSLRDWMGRVDQLPVERVLTLSIELADALARAHHLRIIHRDLKPDNVLLATDGTPRLTDFGLAHIGGSRLTGYGLAPGTFSYLAPEAFSDQPVDARIDIWAFGVMLFELLTGKHPFEARTLEATMSAILTRPVPDLEALRPGLPIPLIDLIYRMLEKDRTARIPNARLVAAELEAIHSGNSPAITPSAIRANATGLSSSSATAVIRQQHNLPATVLSFVGRETELAELSAKLGDPAISLISLIGVGGIGKTRLAIEAARAQIGAFENGVWLVELAPLSAPDRVAHAIAETLGFSIYPVGDPVDQLLSYLRDKSMLLVLDNFEHLLPAADLVMAILSAAPAVKILTTSRERLNLTTENIYSVGGLTVAEDMRSSAIRLFVQGAVRVRPDFHLPPADLPVVYQICQRVGGLPLAILLAAAWVENLNLREILTELEHSLELLETDLRDIPERQRSIRSIFDYSWERLGSAEQDVFKRLSIFRGGFMREAVSAVTGANLRTLTVLINRSLLRRSPIGRYEVHELLRQYAESKLELSPDDQTDARLKHAVYYIQFLAEQDNALQGSNQKAALLLIDEELDNLRTAWDQLEFLLNRFSSDLSASDLNTAWRSMFSLWYYYFFYRHLHEVAPWFAHAEAVLRKHPPSPVRNTLLGMCLAFYASAKWQLAHNEQAAAFQREAESLLEGINEPIILAKVKTINNFLNALLVMRFHPASPELYEQQTRLRATFAGEQQKWWATLAEILLFDTALRVGKNEEGKRHIQSAIRLATDTGDQLLLGWIYALAGHIYNQLGLYPEALDAGQEAETLFKNFGLKLSTVRHWFTLSQVYANLGDLEKSEYYAKEVVRITRDTGNRIRLFSAYALLNTLAWDQHNFGAALEYSQQMVGVMLHSPNQQFLAGAYVNVGQAASELRRFDQAWANFQEGLAISLRIKDIGGQLEALAGLANIFGIRGEPARAITWLTYFNNHPASNADIQAPIQRNLKRLRAMLSDEEILMAQNAAQTLELETLLSEALRPA